MPTNKPEVVLPELPSITRYRVDGDIAYPVSEDPDGSMVDYDGHVAAMRAYGQACIDTLTRPVAGGGFVMVPREPTWIVNDIGELGVMVDGVPYFLYKGDNIVYHDAVHDDGSPMLYRIVGKREFGEVCHPLKWVLAGREERRYSEELVYTPGLSFGRPEDGEWRQLPMASRSAAPQQNGQEVGECAANSFGHKFGPHGPGRSIQCEYCGDAQQPAEAVAEVVTNRPSNYSAGHRIKWLTDAVLPVGTKLYREPPIAFDLAQFREAVIYWSAQQVMPERIERGRHLLAIIDSAPPAIDIGKLRELVARWRADKADDAHSISVWDQGYAHGRNECSDELAALIGDGAEKGNG